MLQGRKLILIKLTFFNIIKGDNIIGFKIGDNGLNSILFSQIDNNGRTACQISKNIADLQLVQGKIPAVHFCISFLQQAHPYLIASAWGKFWFSKWLAWDVVINGNSLPFSIFTQ